MKSQKILYAAAVLILACMAFVIYSYFGPPMQVTCGPGDAGCLSAVDDLREACTPSVSTVTIGNSTNYVKIRITIYRQGGKCYTREEIVEDHQSDLASYDLTGRNVTCNVSGEDLLKFGPHACEGSIFDFAVSMGGGGSGGGSGGDGFGDGTPESEPPNLYCTIEDTECKQEGAQYISNCVVSEILGTEKVKGYEGDVYMTLYVSVDRTASDCSLFYHVINAVNLPPEIPPQIIGMNMTCTISLSYFPIYAVEQQYCEGSLKEYFDLI